MRTSKINNSRTPDEGLAVSTFSRNGQNIARSNIGSSLIQPSSSIVKGKEYDLLERNISRKPPEMLHKEGLGFNPNVKIENEYINNLMKQIHFMNMEINLMKEKNNENRNVMGLRGMVAQDGQPITDHLITAQRKFLEMQDHLTKRMNALNVEKLNQSDVVKQWENKYSHLVTSHHHNLVELKEVTKSNAQIRTELESKLNEERRKRIELENNRNKVKKQLDDAIKDNLNYIKTIEQKTIENSVAKELPQLEETKQKEEISFKDKKIEQLKAEIIDLNKALSEDFQLKELYSKNHALHQQLKEEERNVIDLNYKVIEMEHLQQLSIKQKDLDAENRRSIQEDYDRLKQILDDTLKNNRLKVERKIRENECVEIKNLEIRLQKEQKELNDLRKKHDELRENYKAFLIDRMNKNMKLTVLQKEKAELEKVFLEVEKDVDQMGPTVDNLFHERDELIHRIEEYTTDKSKLEKKAQEHKLHLIELQTSVDILSKSVNLDNDLKKLNLDDLKQLTTSNTAVNETIEILLKKSEALKKFSKPY